MKPVIARTSTGAAALALALASAAALAGCEREAAPAAAPPPPPPVEQPLAGAPEGPPPPPAVVAPEGPPPPQAMAPEGPPPPPAMEAPTAAEPGIVAMAPIPNPPETAPVYRRHAHRYAEPYGAYAHRGYGRRVHRTHAAAPPVASRQAAPSLRHTAARPLAPSPPHAAAPAATTGAAATGVATTHHGKTAAAQAHHRSTATTTTTQAAAAGPRADRLAALQTALGGAMAQSAKLDTPHFQPNQPADVSLTVPAQFAETLRTEAGRQGLADDAASVALVARLAGDGYVVIPDTVQRQMLAAGQPTVFHWTVTEQPGARGPLEAGVAAQLMGGSGQDQLDLGVVKAAQASGMGWKVVGAIILLLVLAAIVALIARAGSGPRAAQRRRKVDNLSGVRPAQRPFDMAADRRDEVPPPRV